MEEIITAEANKTIIFIPKEGNYIEILGHKIDGYSSFESFLDELKELQDVREKNKELEEQIEEYKLNAEENMHEAQENARLFRKEQAKKNEYKKIVELMSKVMHYICLFSSQSKYVIEKYCKIYNSKNIGECEGLICSECVADYFRKKASD